MNKLFIRFQVNKYKEKNAKIIKVATANKWFILVKPVLELNFILVINKKMFGNFLSPL